MSPFADAITVYTKIIVPAYPHPSARPFFEARRKRCP